MHGVIWIEQLARDVRLGLRMMAKHPGSTALAILILALGIGGNTAVFSVVDKVILNPIPGRDMDKLLSLREVDVVHNAKWGVSPPMFGELCTFTNIFASLSAYFQSPESVTLERGAEAIKLHGVLRTTPAFFELLGERPLAGRTFLPSEGGENNGNVLVASCALWQEYFAGDPKFIGRTITLNGQAYQVIGIMPPTFQFPNGPGANQFWVPHRFTSEETTNPDSNGNRVYSVLARLQKGASLAQARALLDTVVQRRQKQFPETNKRWIIEANPARTLFVGPMLEPTLWSLQAAVFMLLLISCANVGTLLLARAIARQGEFSIRMAIGAGRRRMARQLLTESLLLAVVAGLLGIFIAWGALRALDHFYLQNLQRLRTVGLDWSVLTLMLGVSGLSGVVFGVAPAWLASHLKLSESLKNTAQQQSGGALQRLFQDGLVVLQISLAVVLLVGAGLMIVGTVRLLRVDPGLDAKGLYALWYDPNPLLHLSRPDFEAAKQRGLSRREAIREWWPQEIARELQWDTLMVERLRTVPGIESAAINGNTGGNYAYGDYRVEGRADLVQLSESLIGIQCGDYFHTLRVALVSGRLLTKEDCVPGNPTVVINQELARRCWPGQNPLGKRLFSAGQFKEEFVVVGVVKNLLDWRKDTPQQPTFYEPVERITEYSPTRGKFVLRSNLSPELLREVVVKLGREMVPRADVSDFYSVEAQLYASTASRRIFMWLLGSLGGLGLFLSALGVYAVIAYTVVRRTREIGIRLALGATRGQIARLVLGRGGRLVLNGIILGGVAAFTLARYLGSLIHGVTPGDPWVYGSVLAILGSVAAIACYLPSRRALKIDPMKALRYE
jgi:putative ABC transport system permease protein